MAKNIFDVGESAGTFEIPAENRRSFFQRADWAQKLVEGLAKKEYGEVVMANPPSSKKNRLTGIGCEFMNGGKIVEYMIVEPNNNPQEIVHVLKATWMLGERNGANSIFEIHVASKSDQPASAFAALKKIKGNLPDADKIVSCRVMMNKKNGKPMLAPQAKRNDPEYFDTPTVTFFNPSNDAQIEFGKIYRCLIESKRDTGKLDRFDNRIIAASVKIISASAAVQSRPARVSAAA